MTTAQPRKLIAAAFVAIALFAAGAVGIGTHITARVGGGNFGAQVGAIQDGNHSAHFV